jgi:IclR family acetate operon transcriptional repressor
VAVKPLRSATRVLAVLEAVAAHQPVGLGELTRRLEEDKSAVQRALATLADDGWIRTAPGTPPRWELTTRSLVMASQATVRSDLRRRARVVLEALRDQTDESALLAVPDASRPDALVPGAHIPTATRIVTLDVVESRQLVRAAPHVGMVIPTIGSAAGQALLARLDDDALTAFLGAPADPALTRSLATVRRRGWALNHGDVVAQASGIAAAVLDAAGQPVAAVAISAPSERLPRARHEAVGRIVADAARSLSDA